jgi:hypothetical protein
MEEQVEPRRPIVSGAASCTSAGHRLGAEEPARGLLAFAIPARPTGFEPVASAFVGSIHATSNTCGNVQTHAGESRIVAGLFLHRMATDSEVRRSAQSLFSVRQVAELPGAHPALTISRLSR